MFFITDKNGVIQDIASRQENLSRGYTFVDYKVFPTSDMHHATIGDTYKDGLFLIDTDRLAAAELRNNQQFMVTAKTRQIAIDQLIAEGKLPADYTEG